MISKDDSAPVETQNNNLKAANISNEDMANVLDDARASAAHTANFAQPLNPEPIRDEQVPSPHSLSDEIKSAAPTEKELQSAPVQTIFKKVTIGRSSSVNKPKTRLNESKVTSFNSTADNLSSVDSPGKPNAKESDEYGNEASSENNHAVKNPKAADVSEKTSASDASLNKTETIPTNSSVTQSQDFSSGETDKTGENESHGGFNIDQINLLKNFKELLSRGAFAGSGYTVNNFYYGDNIFGDSTKMDFGENNDFGDININKNDGASPENTGLISTVLSLSDYDAIFKYIDENRQSPYCSLLITLAIFDYCQYDLVCEEAKTLYMIITDSETKTVDKNGSAVVITREPFDISRQEAVKKFAVYIHKNNIITHGGRILTDFIRFSAEDHALNILRCVYSEFIELRDKITRYIIGLIRSELIVMYSAAIKVLKKTCVYNPEYFIKTALFNLYMDKSMTSDIAIVELLCSIAEYSKNTDGAEMYLNSISGSDRDVHYYVIMLLLSKNLLYKREKIAKLAEPMIWELIEQPRLALIYKRFNMMIPEKENYLNNISAFYLIGDRYAEYFIAFVHILYDILNKMKKNDERITLVYYVTMLFIKADFIESQRSAKDKAQYQDMVFIRLVLRDGDTKMKLIYLWNQLLTHVQFKKTAYQYIEEYLLLRDGFIDDDNEYKKLEYFFIVLAQDNDLKRNIINFLKNLFARPKNSIKIARKISEKLEAGFRS